MIQRNFKLALTAGRTIPLVIPASQYDSGEQWIFTLIDETGAKYTPATGAIIGLKSDKTAILNAGTVDAAGRVVINETEQMTAAIGKNVYEILIDDQTHGSANFIVMVEPRPGDQADFSDSDLSLLEQAIQGTSETAIKAGVSEWMTENMTGTSPAVDSSLSITGAAADAKKTGDEISSLKSAISRGSGLTNDIKLALLNIFKYVQFFSAEGESAYEALETALNPPTNLSYITAVYTQGSTIVYDTDSLDSLRSNLVVTAHYDDLTTETVTAYTLSGSLTVGTSTITVTYAGKTTTFTVTVTSHSTVPTGYTAYDYLYRSANFGNSQLKVTLIKTQAFDNLNNKIIDFDFMPTIALSSATSIIGGSIGSGNDNQVAFFTRTDTKRVSCFSHGTALAIEGVDSIAINSKTHVNLNPHSASPSTLTVGSETYDGAWSSSRDIASELTICGNSSSGTSGNGAAYEGIRVGTVKVYALDNTLLGEYIPCVRNSDNVIGVYDTVGGNFYTSYNATYATIGNTNCSYGVGNW